MIDHAESPFAKFAPVFHILRWLTVTNVCRSYYNHLVKPCDLPDLHDCCMFKNGIKPLSEDDANKGGGKWTLRLKKGLASRLWEDLVLAVIGGAYDLDKVFMCLCACGDAFQCLCLCLYFAQKQMDYIAIRSTVS